MSTSVYDPKEPFAPPLLIGHSLSWKNERVGHLGPNNTMCAKIWRPEVPKSSSTTTTKPSGEDKNSEKKCDSEKKKLRKSDSEHKQPVAVLCLTDIERHDDIRDGLNGREER